MELGDQWAPDKGLIQSVRRCSYVPDRTRTWVESRRGALADAVSEPLAAYLDSDQEHLAERLRAFESRFQSACNSAWPMVMIDEKIRRAVHGDKTEVLFTMTPLPFPTGHPARERAEKVLLGIGIQRDKLGAHFTDSAISNEINVFGYLGTSVHPVVVSSLTNEIATSWAKERMSTAKRRDFWGSLRRAHTLELFVPLKPAVQRALVRGWYVAALLGYLDGVAPREDIQDGIPELEPKVWSPKGWLGFPVPLLGDPVYDTTDLLPAILESFPVALLEVSDTGNGSVDAYGRLIELAGHSLAAPGAATRLRDPLIDWIRTGHTQDATADGPVSPLSDAAERRSTTVDQGEGATAGSLPEARRTEVLEGLGGPRRTYAEEVLTIELNGSEYRPDRRWEIGPLVISVLDELIALVRRVPLDGERDETPVPLINPKL